MKMKSSFILKSSVALILAFLMLFGTMTTSLAAVVDEFADTGAEADVAKTGASTWTFYLAIKDPTNYYGGSTIKCNVNRQGDADNFASTTMTDTGKYWAGRSLYTCSVTDLYSGLGALQFQVYDGSTWKEQWQVWGTQNWHSYSTDYSGHVFVYDTESYSDTYSTSNAKYGWTKGDYYIYNNITDSWYNGNSAPKMTVDSSDSSRRYYDFYLKQNEKTSTDYLLFRFWDSSDSEQVGPAWQSGHRSSISGKTASSPATDVKNITNYGDGETAWQYPTNGFTSGKYYRVRVYFDTDYNGTGGVWATNTALTNMDPTFSTTSFEQGTSYNLTSLVGVTSGSNVGTVTYSTYQYYDGSSWTTISTPSSWTPSSTSITKLRVTATDGGVKSTGDNDKRNAYSARTETKETAITVTNNTPTITSFTIGGGSSATLNIGGTATLASEKANSTGTVTYSTTSDAISISGNTVTALKPVTSATITASLTGATSKTVTVTVSTPTVTVTNYTGKKIGDTGSTGLAMTNGGTCTISYASDNDVVSVNSSTGAWTAQKPGTATITGTISGGSYSTTKTFTVAVGEPTLSFATSTKSLKVGETYTQTATSGNCTTAGSISYSTTSTYISVNSSSGLVTAIKPTTSAQTVTATFTVTQGGQTTTKTASYNVTVTTPTLSITSGATVAVGDTLSLTATSDATTTPTYTWSVTSGGSYGSISGSTLTGNAAGTVTVQVSAKYNNSYTQTTTKQVSVQSPAITVKDGSTTLTQTSGTTTTVYTTVGTNKTLTITPNFSDTLTAKSSKSSVATVSLSGSTLTITPVAAGTCNVSVSTDSGYAPTGVDLAGTAAAAEPDGPLKDMFDLVTTGAVSTTTVTIPVSVAAAESGHVVYLTDNAGWGSAVIHAWEADGSGAIANRAAMTKVGVNTSNQDVYAYRFSDSDWAKVQHIRFLKSSSTTWDGNSDQTVTITSFTSNAWYTSDSSSPRNVGTWNCTLEKPQITASDISIGMGTTGTMTATVLTSQTPSTFNWSSGTTSVATTADTHTASNVITAVYPGTSTITIKAYANKTSDFSSIVTDGTADDFVAGTTTATATVTADPKTVTFGGKITSDGSTYTDQSGLVTAKYYDEDTSGSGSGSGSGSSSSGSGAGYYVWYNTNNSKDLGTATCSSEMIDLGDGTCYTSFTCAAGQNYDIVINQSSSTASSILTSSTTVTGNQSWAKIENNGSTYWALDSYSASVPIYVIYNNSANSVTFTTTNPASSSGSGSSGSGSGSATGEGTSFNSGDSVPYGKIAVFTAAASYTSGSDTYTFAEWVDGSGNTLGTDSTYSVKITDAQTVYARYYKVYKLSAFDSYTSDGTNVTFATAPPRIITVKHGDETYIYTYDGTADTGNPDSPDGDLVAALDIGSGTYGQGNYIQYYAGDEITLYYNSMASSEIFKGVFYNNSTNYYIAKPTAEQYVAHTYTSATTLYMNSAYYDISVPSGLPSTTVDHDAHSIKFSGTQDYKNIDVEIGTKRKVYFSDYTNAVIGSKNTDDYYYDGEALSVTGDQLTVAAAKSSTQTNVIVGSNVGFYKANADGTKGDELTSAQITDLGLSVTNATSTGTTSADGTALVISGNMPSYDLYIDLNMTNSYTIKLGSKVVSDTFASKTRLAEVANITINEGSTTKLTAPNNADVTSTSYSAPTATALTLTTAYTGSWDDYYTFVGWYWGDDSAPDYEKGFISDKLTLNYTPKKGGTIWAVGTRSLYINGSKYITGKDTDWYGENNQQKNLEMSFDAETGRYYWEITDTMFAAAGSNYKTWNENNSSATTEYGRYYTGGDSNYYWYNTDDQYHGKGFFQILDEESGNANKTLWDAITSFKEDTPANGPTYGKVYPEWDNDTDNYNKRHNGQGFINFNESDYPGYSSPLRIWYDPSASGNAKLTVTATKIYSDIYVSNGYSVGSTLKTSAVTVQPVVDGSVVTSGQTGYFSVGASTTFSPDVEGTVTKYTPAKKNATVRITKTAGGSDKISAFFIYDIANKTVRAEKNVVNSGSNYYIDLTLASEQQQLYIVPIVEEANANVTITFDATQLNRTQWGDIVTAYAWYQNSGGAALGDYPGQPMIPSDDMTTWTAKFKGVNSSNAELEGITFSNYVDNQHSWLGCSGVMGTVTYGGSGTSSSPTTVTIADDGIIKQYNNIESGNYKEYSRANFKAQTYDYREPIALYDRFKSSDNVTISFSMKDGNSSLLSWRHSELLSHNIVTLEPDPDWGSLNWEYLTNAKGDKYIDMNGNTIKTKPTASFYVAAKGLVLYNNSSMTNVFYSGYSFDAVSDVTYGGASGVSMNYAVQWYVYDASGNYITNVLTAGIADLASNNVDSFIGKTLEDMGYAVDGKSVAICYDKPRYMSNDSNSASSGQAAGYNGKGINVGGSFNAYRFTGQWNAVASSELVTVKVGVGMMTDSGEVLAGSNTAAYGSATASYDTTKGNNTSVTNEDGDTAPFTASDGSFVRTAVRDAENNPVKLNATSQNFIGWYYYDANTGEFTKATYTGNENFYPSYSTKDVTFYAMYKASAVYNYIYTGREGSRTYSAAGEDLVASEMTDNKVVYANHSEDVLNKLPVGIGIFKKNISFAASDASSWTKDNNTEYTLKISGFNITSPTYTLTAYYKNASGTLVNVSTSAIYNASAVDLTSGSYTDSSSASKPAGESVVSYYGTTDHRFLGWYEYDGTTIGDLLSTQANYGMRLTKNQSIIAVYDEDSHALPSDGWHVAIDENEVNKELTTSTTGVFYNDTIVRVRNSDDVKAALPSGSKIGVLVVCDNNTGNTINSYTTAQLNTLVGAISSGSTRKTALGLSITNLQATGQTSFNRTDIAVRADYKQSLGAKYCVYAYFYDGSSYTFSEVSAVKTYE